MTTKILRGGLIAESHGLGPNYGPSQYPARMAREPDSDCCVAVLLLADRQLGVIFERPSVHEDF